MCDIETAPNEAYVWRFFKENIGANQIIENCKMISWGAKWLGKSTVYYEDTEHQSEKSILKKISVLLDEADMVVGHNLAAFDMPKIRGRSLVYKLPLPSPYREFCTYKTAVREFGFDSNSLEFLAKALGCKNLKFPHSKFPGFLLWRECMAGNPEAWKEMKKYNKQDVIVTEEVYLLMRPYARYHPNVAVHSESENVQCPKCGSEKLVKQKNGSYHKDAYTNVGKYKRYQCGDCGGYHRSRFTEYPKEHRKALAVNVT